RPRAARNCSIGRKCGESERFISCHAPLPHFQKCDFPEYPAFSSASICGRLMTGSVALVLSVNETALLIIWMFRDSVFARGIDTCHVSAYGLVQENFKELMIDVRRAKAINDR